MSKKIATLVLEDGSSFVGTAFGSEGESIGEIVFNTGMTGYQEILTDPSYYGQLVVMTYPLIGNYGINLEDFESVKPRVFGFVVKEYAESPSHWRSKKSLDQFLKEHRIIGIAGIDTRMITRKIREKGTMKAIITTNEINKEEALQKLQSPLRNDQVSQVSIKQPFNLPGRGSRVVLVDYGYKQGILRELLERHCEVTVVPYDTNFETIKNLSPDGVLLSNGPGDPKDVNGAVETIKEIIANEIPLFGICLGHQLFALANGADTKKMKFGHRGVNHPVKELETNKIYMTSQNHGYSVSNDSVNNCPLKVTHIAINDGTIEGLAHRYAPAFSVQYHPEASPGPYDSTYLFDQFIQLMRNEKERKKDAQTSWNK
ncbi:carbamoyl phosphate synthase small subunit [Vulcanibacillus modesticaldus]|uniref:Carbamoyl phosphate synthase small chain n=1 Tax=Vulcanibacillus modesticaldus TaxID=337097 RepID=A0A1D2YTS6_9BACI|nr:carbamoyl phosphate synthase small subunit [Vulcanibacillus modesticaldus]OEF99102.1 carbamoyl phosphate synthase small subunit [Vulcanibacillus modesticaldus]